MKMSDQSIAETVANTLETVGVQEPASVAEVLEIDRESRRVAGAWIAGKYGKPGFNKKMQPAVAVRA